MAENKDIGALWKREKDGKEYFTGNITLTDYSSGAANLVVHEIVVFKNSYKKEGDKTPDWRIYPSKPRAEAVEEPVAEEPGAEIPF